MSSYKLVYFDGRGRGEIARFIFAAAGAEYTDHRVPWETLDEWATIKPNAPIGQLPYLEVNGVRIPQSISIARYVAREFGLAGKDNLQQAQVDAIVDTLSEIINTYYSRIYPIEDADEKAKAFEKFLAEDGAKCAADMEKLIGLYGSNGYSVGDSLTWADLFIYDTVTSVPVKLPKLDTAYPKLAAVRDSVAKNEKIAAYVASRPEATF